MLIANIFSIFQSKIIVKECNNFKFQLNYGPLLNFLYILFVSFFYKFTYVLLVFRKV